jgi:hypothetical protein
MKFGLATFLQAKGQREKILAPPLNGGRADGEEKPVINPIVFVKSRLGMLNAIEGARALPQRESNPLINSRVTGALMIEQMAIFSATLGLSPPWVVTAATFAKESNRLDLKIEYSHVSPVDCPICGKSASSTPAGTMVEIWFHEDFFRYSTYLHAQVPVMTCCCGCEFPLERPWSRVGSKFSRVS